MSYILEALKKSQSERELGQVPRVEGFGIDVPIEPPRRRPWAYLGLLIALAALGIGGIVLLRGLSGPPAQTPDLALPEPGAADLPGGPAATASADLAQAAPAQALPSSSDSPAAPAKPASEPAVLRPSPGATSRDAAPGDAAGASPSVAARLPQPSASSTAAQSPVPQPLPLSPTLPSAAPDAARTAAGSARREARGALPLTDPEGLSVEPEVLVVPAPAKPGESLPRGAEELRRAVLGGAGGLSASVDGPSALPAPPPPEPPSRSALQQGEYAPVPNDLRDEIEAFKELVRKNDPAVAKRAAAAAPPLPEPPGLASRLPPHDSPLPPAPSLDLRNRLPPFSMTVHVYNPDPKRRFVYINGRKLAESEQSREGLRLERIVADGAVLSFDGERFFQRR